jgi:hypothetical protein
MLYACEVMNMSIIIKIYSELNVIIGLAITVILGLGVGCFVRYVGKEMGPLPAPNDKIAPQKVKA